MVEQAAVNRKVEGSSPSSAAKLKNKYELYLTYQTIYCILHKCVG